MTESLITSPAGIIAVLAIVTSFFFFLEKKTGSPLFNYLPPLIFIYLTPVLLSNIGFIPSKAPVYDFMGDVMLPVERAADELGEALVVSQAYPAGVRRVLLVGQHP